YYNLFITNFTMIDNNHTYSIIELFIFPNYYIFQIIILFIILILFTSSKIRFIKKKII
ncbi:unnamed protein product, partial [Heterotrigona itama]